MKRYTHPEIQSKPATSILPEKIGLILEGNGPENYYTAGVLDTFLAYNLMFSYIAAVSNASAVALSYLSGQRTRNKDIAKFYACKSSYSGWNQRMKQGSVLNLDFLLKEIPEKHVFFDWNSFQENNTTFLTGALESESASTVWFPKNTLDVDLFPIKASCSLPVHCPMVEYRGKKYLDGRIADAIPIEKSVADGNDFHVIILTSGLEKKPHSGAVTRSYYKNHPNLASALEHHHSIYNAQLALCEKLEQEGKALVLRPRNPIPLGERSRKRKHILALYQQGERDSLELIHKLEKML